MKRSGRSVRSGGAGRWGGVALLPCVFGMNLFDLLLTNCHKEDAAKHLKFFDSASETRREEPFNRLLEREQFACPGRISEYMSLISTIMGEIGQGTARWEPGYKPPHPNRFLARVLQDLREIGHGTREPGLCDFRAVTQCHEFYTVVFERQRTRHPYHPASVIGIDPGPTWKGQTQFLATPVGYYLDAAQNWRLARGLSDVLFNIMFALTFPSNEE